MFKFDNKNRVEYNQQYFNYFLKLFTKAKEERKVVRYLYPLTEKEKDIYEGSTPLYMIIEDVSIENGGCNHCNTKYNSIYIQGKISTEDNIFDTGIGEEYRFDANISPYYIMCTNFQYGNDDPPLLLLKCCIDRTENYIHDYFIDENTLIIL